MGLDAKIFIFWMMSFKPAKTKLAKKNFRNQLRNVLEYTVQIYFQECMYEYIRQNGRPKMSPPQILESMNRLCYRAKWTLQM